MCAFFTVKMTLFKYNFRVKTKFCLILISAWLAMTFTIDFMVLPKVFSVIKDVFMGGKIGSGLFSTFNLIELVFATVLIGLAFTSNFSKSLHQKLTRISSVILFLISSLYQFYFTPGIINATNTILSIPETEVERRAAAFLEQQFFHQWYIRVDSLKILLLGLVLVLFILQKDQVDKDNV